MTPKVELSGVALLARRRRTLPRHQAIRGGGQAVAHGIAGRRQVAGDRPNRAGAATIDYVLILAVILPLVLFSIVASRQILGLAYEFLCVMVSWPFM